MYNQQDKSQEIDNLNIMQTQDINDHQFYKTEWTLKKFVDGSDTPFEVAKIDGNMMVNSGINLMTTLLAGGSGTAFSNANSYLGVGDSNAAEAATQTDLQAATNKLRVAMNASYPTYGTSQQIVFQSTFTSLQANFHWQEFGVFNASSGGTMLNRKVSDQGTKVSGQTWQLTLTITFS